MRTRKGRRKSLGFMTRGTLVFITISRKEGLFPAMTNERGEGRGRDEFARWTSTGIGRVDRYQAKNLLSEHKRRMDLLREERWYVAERERLANRAEEMEEEATGKDEKKAEEVAPEPADEDTEDFVPGPFLPQGIEPENNPPENMGKLLSRPSLRIQAYPPWKGMSRPRLTWKNRRPPFPLSERLP